MGDAIDRQIPPHVLDEWHTALFRPHSDHASTLE
jgi:hypothetical protein